MYTKSQLEFTSAEQGTLTLFCYLLQASAYEDPDDDLFDTGEMTAVLVSLIAKLNIDMSDEYISHLEQEAFLEDSVFLSNLASEIKDCKAGGNV